MKVLTSLALGMAFCAHAQSPSQSEPIADYIHHSWDTLSRSMSECKSVVDTKVTTAPILYLPAAMTTPPAVVAMQKQCGVQIAHLPRPIAHMGDVKVVEIPKDGLLYLPNPYVVPGGRFNEMYGWDTYFILLGLVQDNRVATAQGIVENFFFEIENYGAILNANRTYYFTRSQPPLLSSMIAEVYARNHDKAWLAHAYSYAKRDHALWTQSTHLAGPTGLARYDDLGDGPVPEMADDSTYFSDVIRWLRAHPDVHTSYLVEASAHPDAAEATRLRTVSCDIAASKVCAGAYADGHRLSAAFFHGDRAMRESGFDTSFRFGPFSGSADQFAPVCLNSLLYKYERDLATFAHELGKQQEEEDWNGIASRRKAAVDKYLWQADAGLYYDYNFVTGQSSQYNFISTFYPLWAGLATPQQAAAVQQHLALFEHEGGVAMSDRESGVQWDLPYGWAPTNWFAVAGLDRYGFHQDASRIARAFIKSVNTNYLHDGTIREKYNVVSADGNVKVSAGYKSNVIGFGWTNGVYVSMQELLKQVQSLPATAGPGTILSHEQLDKLIPATVFFRGQTATVQLRNSAGVRFSNELVVLVAKVDTGGYATGIQERYQDYLITEVPLALGSQTLPPGAYGVGFLNNSFIVMNLGGQELFKIPTQSDVNLKRPTPLQILAESTGGFRLYSGRNWIPLTYIQR